MRKYICLFFQICLLLIVGAASSLEASDAAASLPYLQLRKQRQSLLVAHRLWAWEIGSSRGRLWIVGCLHLGTLRDTAVFPRYLPVYRKASAIYFETLPDSWKGDDIKRLITRRGFVEDRQSLSARISKETWQELHTLLRSKSDTLATISSMQPWLVAFTLVQDGYARAGLDSGHSLEAFLKRLAIDDGKPVGGLETPKDQILAMADASFADQEEFLLGTLRGLGKLTSDTQALRDAWVQGNGTRLQSILGLDSTVRSGMHQNLISRRNERWVAKIKDIVERHKNSLVVVGIEHLVAKPDSLLDLLEQAGFSIRRIDGVMN